MVPTHDLLVIGAGPAGSSAALRGRQMGLSVALIDKARFPRDKLCGGGITGRCRTHLEALFTPLPASIWRQAEEVNLHASGVQIARLTNMPPIAYTMRQDLDAALLTQALTAGAEDVTGQRIAEMDLATGTVRTVSGRLLAGRVILGADGVNSAVARALFGRAHDPDRIGFALEAEVPLPEGEALPLLDVTAADWGYAWAFPKHGSVTLGIGGRQSRNPNLRATFEAWLLAQGHDPAKLRIRGHHLPFGDPRPPPGRGAVLLAGDAAGFVDPITGEGIAWAVKSGALAAEAAAAALGQGQPNGAMSAYCKRIRPVLTELSRARRLAHVVYHPRLQPRFLQVLARSERVQRRYFDLLAGRLDYADLGPASLARMGWRLLTGRG
jgi:menaquinone-9 beta-reductase